MSLETIEGIEEIQEDVADKGDALDKKLKIHLPIKQPSYSSVSSRRSSINVVADYPETAIDDPQFQKKNVKNLGKFSTIKEKIKKDGKKKKKKVKALQQKVTANKKLKDISDNDANNDKYDEDYESEPDVSEIVLTKPKVYSKIEKDRNEDFDGPKSEIKAAKEIKKSSKRGQKKSKKRMKRKMFSSDPAAAELERLLAEKDKLLRDELAKLDPTKAPSKPDSSFYPPPKNLEKRRCYFHKGAKALKCTVCSGVHYRTRRTFKSNLRILAKINMTFLNVLNDMRGKMTTIDGNLHQVKRNLEYLEEMYDTIFRKVNRLFVDVDIEH